MIMRLHCFLLFSLFLLLGACASGPNFNTYGVDRALTPRGVAAAPQPASGKLVLWGGVIVSTANLKDRTQIEVLAYPLDSNERPKQQDDPLGRFILEQAGYLEPASYAEGRLVTVVGTVSGVLPGTVGESDYTFPLVTARQLTLWPTSRGDDGTSIHFGIGAGSGGSWGGMGIGF
jgi:outer membrane lipoprotein